MIICSYCSKKESQTLTEQAMQSEQKEQFSLQAVFRLKGNELPFIQFGILNCK